MQDNSFWRLVFPVFSCFHSGLDWILGVRTASRLACRYCSFTWVSWRQYWCRKSTNTRSISRLPNREGGAASHGKGELEHVKGAYRDATDLKYIREG